MRRCLPVTPMVLLAAGCSQRITPIGPGFIYEPDKREQRLWATTEAESEKMQASGALYEDLRLTAYVNGVLDRLISDNRDAYLPLKPRTFILDSASVNAFALPHGDVYVHTGILGRIRNEAQLAMLLGHELTHSTHRHAYQRLEHAYAASGAAAYTSVVASLGGGNIQNLVGGLSQLMMVASVSGYSRSKERESDDMGLTLVAQAGYDPNEGRKMFERMLAASDRDARGLRLFYATHPKMKDRVTCCQELVTRLPAELLSKSKDVGTDRYLAVALPLVFDEVERHITQGRYDLAEETLTFLEKQRSGDARSHAYRGELCRSRCEDGDEVKGRAAYDKALALNPREAIALRGLGLMCMKEGDTAGAIRYLDAYVRQAPGANDARLIRQMADQLRSKPR